jgi:hypothetical protein
VLIEQLQLTPGQCFAGEEVLRFVRGLLGLIDACQEDRGVENNDVVQLGIEQIVIERDQQVSKGAPPAGYPGGCCSRQSALRR